MPRPATALPLRFHRPVLPPLRPDPHRLGLSCRHRFITECIFTAGQVGVGHWSCFHRFFSHYAWSLDDLCRVRAGLLINRFCPDGPVLLAADDTQGVAEVAELAARVG